MPKTQDFSKTGINSIHITWAHDVKPYAEQLTRRGLIAEIVREHVDKGLYIYRVFNHLPDGSVEEFFHTSQIAAVWTYLVGLECGGVRSRKTVNKLKAEVEKLRKERDEALELYVMENQEYHPMKNGTDYIKIPSQKFIIGVLSMRAFSGDQERCIKEWSKMTKLLEAYRKAGRIPYRENITMDQLVLDVQIAHWLEMEAEIGIVLRVKEEI